MKTTCRSKVDETDIVSLILVDHFYDLSVPIGYNWTMGKKNIRTTSYNVLSRCQPTKLNHLVVRYFEVHKGSPRAFWLSQFVCVCVHVLVSCGVEHVAS